MADQNGNKAIIDCPNCGQRFSVEMPKPNTINAPQFSMVIGTHEKVIRCLNANCNQALAFAIVGVELTWAAAPLPPEVAAQMSDTRIIPATIFPVR